MKVTIIRKYNDKQEKRLIQIGETLTVDNRRGHVLIAAKVAVECAESTESTTIEEPIKNEKKELKNNGKRTNTEQTKDN